MNWWWVSVSWATFGICSDNNGRVVEAAPIAGWSLGKRITEVVEHFRARGGTVVDMALTASQIAEIEHQERVAASLDLHVITSGGRRLVNRTTLFEMRKQRFIDDFIASGGIDEYPSVDSDIADENEHVDYTGWLLRDMLVVQVRRAFELCQGPGNIDPSAVASELLRSELCGELTTLKRLPLSELSLPLVLAHLEALAFNLDKRLAISIARRAFILLLNQRHFLPDVRPKHQAS